MLMGMDKVESATERVHVMASPELLASLEEGWTGPVEVKAARPATVGGPWEMAIRPAAQDKIMARLGEAHTAHTMDKVSSAIKSARPDMSTQDIIDIIARLQGAGILFRERV